MVKRKKTARKIGALGPAAHFLDRSIASRAWVKQTVKEGILGYVRSDGVAIPAARRVFKGLEAKNGFDLRHIERWSAARLKKAQDAIYKINTLTSRPFQLLIPRTVKQRRAAQRFTGQDLPEQKIQIAAIADPKHERIKFENNRIVTERKLKGEMRVVTSRYLFDDYGGAGATFGSLRNATRRIMKVIPEYQGGWPVYYMLITVQYGPIGEAVFKDHMLELLSRYHGQYEVGARAEFHDGFASGVIGWQMVGTQGPTEHLLNRLESEREARRKRKKKRWSKRIRVRMK